MEEPNPEATVAPNDQEVKEQETETAQNTEHEVENFTEANPNIQSETGDIIIPEADIADIIQKVQQQQQQHPQSADRVSISSTATVDIETLAKITQKKTGEIPEFNLDDSTASTGPLTMKEIPSDKDDNILFPMEPIKEEGIETIIEVPKGKKGTKHKRRESDFSIQGAKSRFRSSEAPEISGDFEMAESLSSLSFESLESISDEEVQEQATVQEAPKIDRQMYYEMYAIAEKQYNHEKMKNNFLTRKLVDYYRKRRMDHVLKEDGAIGDAQKKYEKQLDALEELSNLSTRENQRISDEIQKLKLKYNWKVEEVKQLSDRWQQLEHEIAKELTNQESAAANVEKIIDKHLKKQKSQVEAMSKMRLNFIKIRNKFNEKQEALDALDNLGPDLHLIDYEQLKMDNRNHHDKLEERENELTKLRMKCRNAMQVLAHRREKAAAIDADINTFNENLENILADFEDVREQMNEIKVEKDMYRHEINRMKDNSGLLTKPNLLLDLQNAMEEVQLMSETLQGYKDDYRTASERLKEVRKIIAGYSSKSVVALTTQSSRNVRKGRSLVVNSDFDF